MSYQVNFCETKEQLKHLAEVVTGKADGSPTGADIDTSTLAYAGLVRDTLPELLSKLGWYSVGDWSSDPLISNDNEYVLYNGIRYVPLSIPYQVNSTANPDPEVLVGTDLKVITDVTDEDITEAQNDIVGGSIFKGSNGEYVQDGDTVPAGTTHLRVLVGGKPTIVSMSPVASGSVSLLTEVGATIGATSVSFYAPITSNYNYVSDMLANPPSIGITVSTGRTDWKRTTGDGTDISHYENLNDVWMEDFGVREGIDVTTELHLGLAFASSRNRTLKGLRGNTYLVRGVDLESYGTIIESSGEQASFRSLEFKTTGAPLFFASSGKSIAVNAGTSTTTLTRGCGLIGCLVTEGNDTDESLGKRHYGFYSLGNPIGRYNITTQGFTQGIMITYQWHSKADNLEAIDFRDVGVGFCEPDLLGLASNLNAFRCGEVHTSTSISSATAGVDARILNSVTIETLTTEGSAANHVMVSQSTRSLNINCWHKEGATTLFLHDKSVGVATVPSGSVNINSGTLFNCGGAGVKFLDVIGSGGENLKSIHLGASLFIQKQSDTEEEFFDMSGVNELQTLADFSSVTDPIIQEYSWHNVGKNSNRTFPKYQSGHNGLPVGSLQKGVYSGVPTEIIQNKLHTGINLSSSAQQLVKVKLGTEIWHEVDVTVEYNSGAFSAQRFVARFWVLQTIDNTVQQHLVSSFGNYALDCVFSINSDVIEVSNPTGFGNFYFKVKSCENVSG